MYSHPIVNPSLHPQINLERSILRNTGPGKAPIAQGVTASCMAPTGDLMLGGGDGTLALMSLEEQPDPKNPRLSRKFSLVAQMKLEGAITAMSLEGLTNKSFTMVVGTAASNIYRVTYTLPTNKCVTGERAIEGTTAFPGMDAFFSLGEGGLQCSAMLGIAFCCGACLHTSPAYKRCGAAPFLTRCALLPRRPQVHARAHPDGARRAHQLAGLPRRPLGRVRDQRLRLRARLAPAHVPRAAAHLAA